MTMAAARRSPAACSSFSYCLNDSDNCLSSRNQNIGASETNRSPASNFKLQAIWNMYLTGSNVFVLGSLPDGLLHLLSSLFTSVAHRATTSLLLVQFHGNMMRGRIRRSGKRLPHLRFTGRCCGPCCGGGATTRIAVVVVAAPSVSIGSSMSPSPPSEHPSPSEISRAPTMLDAQITERADGRNGC